VPLLNDDLEVYLKNSNYENHFHFSKGLEIMLKENMWEGFTYGEPLNVAFSCDNITNEQSINFNKAENIPKPYVNEISVRVSMVYGLGSDCQLSYLNNMRTFGHGTHVRGLYDGIMLAFKEYVEARIKESVEVTEENVRKNLNFVIQVKMNHRPYYEGSVHRELANTGVYEVVKRGVHERLTQVLKEDDSFIKNSKVLR